MFAVVDFDGHLTEAVIVGADVVRGVQMSVNLFDAKQNENENLTHPKIPIGEPFTKVSSRKSFDEALVIRMS